MTPSQFRRTFDAETSRIRKLARRSIGAFGSEDVHDLRVEIKRLRALFGLIANCNPRFNRRKEFNPFRKLFKAAGDLREAQVGLALAREKARSTRLRLDEYRNALKEDEVRGRDTFAAAARGFRISARVRAGEAIDEALRGLDARALEVKTESRLNDLERRLLRLKRPKPAKRDFHRIRGQAKKTRYTLEILQDCFQPDNPALGRLNDRLRAVHQALGRWHDLELAAASLREFMEKRADRPLGDERSYAKYARIIGSESLGFLAEFEKAWEDLRRLTDL